MHSINTPAHKTIAVCVLSAYCGVILVILAILGPAFLNRVPYRTAPAMIDHIIAQDLINLLLAAPLCFTGAVLVWVKRPAVKRRIINPGLYVLYLGLVYGTGNEWSNPLYNTANRILESYCWLFLSLVPAGFYLGLAALTLCRQEDAPVFSGKQKKLFISITLLCLVFFSILWLTDIDRVAAGGQSLFDISYTEAPAAFWIVKYLDLGIIIPSSFLALYLFGVNPQKGYPVLLLLFGFFIPTLTATVLLRIGIHPLHSFVHPYTLLLIFLTLLSYGGYGFLIFTGKPGITNIQRKEK